MGKIPWRREWLSAPVFLPGESRGWRSLGGYRPRGRKEPDVSERRTLLVLEWGPHPRASEFGRCDLRWEVTILLASISEGHLLLPCVLKKGHVTWPEKCGQK